ncbi:hypothetical protein RSAG8_04468, partial [Rhizoctonia solani AG-8 WAC10335]
MLSSCWTSQTRAEFTFGFWAKVLTSAFNYPTRYLDLPLLYSSPHVRKPNSPPYHSHSASGAPYLPTMSQPPSPGKSICKTCSAWFTKEADLVKHRSQRTCEQNHRCPFAWCPRQKTVMQQLDNHSPSLYGGPKVSGGLDRSVLSASPSEHVVDRSGALVERSGVVGHKQASPKIQIAPERSTDFWASIESTSLRPKPNSTRVKHQYSPYPPRPSSGQQIPTNTKD